MLAKRRAPHVYAAAPAVVCQALTGMAAKASWFAGGEGWVPGWPREAADGDGAGEMARRLG